MLALIILSLIAWCILGFLWVVQRPDRVDSADASRLPWWVVNWMAFIIAGPLFWAFCIAWWVLDKLSMEDDEH